MTQDATNLTVPPAARSVDKPFLEKKTYLFVALAIAADLPRLLEPILPLLDERWRKWLSGLALLFAGIAAILARRGGVTAAETAKAQAMEHVEDVLEMGAGGGAEDLRRINEGLGRRVQ